MIIYNIMILYNIDNNKAYVVLVDIKGTNIGKANNGKSMIQNHHTFIYISYRTMMHLACSIRFVND